MQFIILGLVIISTLYIAVVNGLASYTHYNKYLELEQNIVSLNDRITNSKTERQSLEVFPDEKIIETNHSVAHLIDTLNAAVGIKGQYKPEARKNEQIKFPNQPFSISGNADTLGVDTLSETFWLAELMYRDIKTYPVILLEVSIRNKSFNSKGVILKRN